MSLLTLGKSRSVEHEQESAEPREATNVAAPDPSCERCGNPLAPDQEWCLECGAAVRTRIEGAPDWRVPVAVVGGVIVLALAGVACALIKLSSDANRSAAAVVAAAKPPPAPAATTSAAPTPAPVTKRPAAAAPVTTPAPVTAAPAPAATVTQTRTTTTTTTATSSSTTTNPSSTTAKVRIASWPRGLGGWTVILASSKDKASAEETAKQIGAGGTQVGVLSSSEHPSMAPGYWVVFSGRYPNKTQAETAAANLRASGESAAHARLVEPPGGN
jgi:septal ring-binding cell division protein DamX